MILLVHMLFGAAIGASIKNVYLALILAFLSHYLLDLFPHIEYSIKTVGEKQWHKSLSNAIKVLLDFCLGALLILIFSRYTLAIFSCALLAILPDCLSLLGAIFPNKIFKIHNYLHWEKIHFLRDKKISNLWRIFTQVLVVVISLLLLHF